MSDAFGQLYRDAPSKNTGDWADEIVTDFESYKWLALSVLDLMVPGPARTA